LITLIKSFELTRSDYPISVAEMPPAYEFFDEHLNEDEKQQIVETLAFGPECGDVLPGTQNRLREFFWCFGKGKQKRHVRVIYFFYDLNMPLYVIAAFDASSKLTITNREEAIMMELTDKIIAEYAKKNMDLARTQKSSA
jgi:hypothetical protein